MKKFNEVMSALCLVFEREMSSELVGAYKFALSDFTEAELVSAGAELMKGDFFPRPKGFIDLLRPAKPSATDRANAAWNVIVARSCGDKSMEVTDRVTFKAMKGVCDQHMIAGSNEFQLNQWHKRFVSAYKIIDAFEEARENREKLGASQQKAIGDGNG